MYIQGSEILADLPRQVKMTDDILVFVNTSESIIAISLLCFNDLMKSASQSTSRSRGSVKKIRPFLVCGSHHKAFYESHGQCGDRALDKILDHYETYSISHK